MSGIQIGSTHDPDCIHRCCSSTFGTPRASVSGSVVGYDLERQEVVLPADHGRAYWGRLSQAGRLVCVDCLRTSPSIRRTLVYCESPLGLPYFRHLPGEAHYGEGLRGESDWHQAVKDGVARWAAMQPAVESVETERMIPSGRRRTDVGVRMTSGRCFAIEVQYSPIGLELHEQRQKDYLADGVTPIWMYSTDLREPRWAGDGRTFGVRLGPVDASNHSKGSYFELGVLFSHPRRPLSSDIASAEDFQRYAHPQHPGVLGALWVPLQRARLTDQGVVVDPDPVELRRRRGLEEAERAAQRHNVNRLRNSVPWPRSRPVARQPKGTPKPRAATLTCEVCGLPLDEVLARTRRHVYSCS
ncbi:competence protein CoiA family protein [Dietzia kunjamensis]|uniref:competence protein CoiA family protein n=1 Tax=Dietzia kunjamensis TaxID=322509 RepID=UPI003855BB24